MVKKYQVTHSETRVFSGNMKVVAEFSDTEDGFRYRLRKGCEVSPWWGTYDSIARYKFKNGRTFILMTQYWSDSVLKTEEPVELILGSTK
jgi:hypothetical protein